MVYVKKDSYYFAHDAGARNDVRMLKVIDRFGVQGYAYFFIILEIMREQSDHCYPVADLNLLTREFRCDATEVKKFIDYCVDSGLFKIQDDLLYSERFIEGMRAYKELKEKRKIAGSRGGQATSNLLKQKDNFAQPKIEQSSSSKLNILNESKLNKLNESNTGAHAPSKSFKAPTIDEVKAYCTERKNSVDAERFLNFYDSKGWMIGKNKMKDWKACVRTWEKNSGNNGTGNKNLDVAKEWLKKKEGDPW